MARESQHKPEPRYRKWERGDRYDLRVEGPDGIPLLTVVSVSRTDLGLKVEQILRMGPEAIAGTGKWHQHNRIVVMVSTWPYIQAYRANKGALSGSILKCPVCKTAFKKSRGQIFCSPACADKYRHIVTPYEGEVVLP
jgi:hypothetical protein